MSITIDGHEYTVTVEGTGTPCIIIGTAALTYKCLSPRLKQHYQFIVTDLYWNVVPNPLKLSAITLEKLVADIDKIRAHYGLDKFAILAHSTPGFLALEYALQHPEWVLEVILIGTPAYWTQASVAIGETYFEQHASAARKKHFALSAKKFAELDTSKMSASDTWIAKYNSSNAKFWYDFECDRDNRAIWDGITINMPLMDHYFGTLLLNFDRTTEYSKIKAPIFLALGLYDYVVAPSLWDGIKNKMPRLHCQIFEKSSHFPMLEEQALFDDSLLEWHERRNGG